jgi:WD40 repeat protein
MVRRLVTGSSDQTTRIWDARSGAELLTLSTPIAWAVTSEWSPDGRFLAVGKLGDPARVWRVRQSTKKLVDYDKERYVFRELSVAKREQFGLLPR